MRGVTIDPEAQTITAEGGTIWEDVDSAAAKHGLATVGGTVNHTGVGGLTLGGGYGYLTGKYGLTIDNLLSVEVVLASGEAVTASKDTNADLFWAIRGAGQNFGVVTNFTFQGYPQENPVFAGPLVFPPTALPQIVEFMNKFHTTNDGNQALLVGFSSPPPQNAPVILTQLFHNGTEEEGRAIFADLFKLEPLANMSGMVPYPVLNSLLNVSAGFDGRKLFGGGAFKLPLEPAFVEGVYREFQTFVESKENFAVAQSLMLWEVVPYKKVMEVKNEETSFANRGDYYNVATMFKWYIPPHLLATMTLANSVSVQVRPHSRHRAAHLLALAAEEGIRDGGKQIQGRGRGPVRQLRQRRRRGQRHLRRERAPPGGSEAEVRPGESVQPWHQAHAAAVGGCELIWIGSILCFFWNIGERLADPMCFEPCPHSHISQ